MDVRVISTKRTNPIEPWEIFNALLIRSLCLTNPSDWGDCGSGPTVSDSDAVHAEYALDELLLDNILDGGRMSLTELVEAVVEIEGEYEWSAELVERCEALTSESVSGLVEIGHSLEVLMDEEKLLPDGSIFGLAVRSLVIRFRALTFEGLCSLYDVVTAQAKELLDSNCRSQSKSSTASGTLEMADGRPPLPPLHPIHSFRCWHGDQWRQQNLQPRLEAYMLSMERRDYPQALKNHHDYFDALPMKISELTGELVAEPTEGEDRAHHQHLCHAMLQLALLHDTLHHPEISKNVLFEAIGVAETACNAPLFAKALGLLQLASSPGSIESGALAAKFLAKAEEAQCADVIAIAKLRKAWHDVCMGGVRPGNIMDHLISSGEICQKHDLNTHQLQVRNTGSTVYSLFGQRSLAQLQAQLALLWHERMIAPALREPSLAKSSAASEGSVRREVWSGDTRLSDFIEYSERQAELCQAVCGLARFAVADGQSQVGFAILDACALSVGDDLASEARKMFNECRAELNFHRCVATRDWSSAWRWLDVLRVHDALLSRLCEGLLLNAQSQLEAARSVLVSLLDEFHKSSKATRRRWKVGTHPPFLQAKALLALAEVEQSLCSGMFDSFSAMQSLEQCIALSRQHGLVDLEQAACIQLQKVQQLLF